MRREFLMLTRRHSLSLIAASAFSPFCCSFHARAQPLTYTLKPRNLTDGIWVVPGAQEDITLENGGAIANVVILDTTEGAVIIDTGPSRRFGEALRELARQLTGKDVVRVYVSHFHPDHIFGNQAFPRSTLACLQATADGIAQMGNGFSDSMYRIAGDWMRGTDVVVPEKIISSEPEDFGNRTLRPLAMRGHTPGDLAIFDELSGILFTGDLVFLDRAPTTPHADLERWRINLANLGGIPCAMVVPGHGPTEDSDRGIRQTRDWLEAIEHIIRDAFEKGLDIDEAVTLPLPEWTSKLALARYEFTRSVMHLYPKLEAERWPRVDQSK